jgi:tetratricopeptide (TPR) repeat protein
VLISWPTAAQAWRVTEFARVAPRRIITPAPFQAAPLPTDDDARRDRPLPVRALAILLVLAAVAVALLMMLPHWTPPTATITQSTAVQALPAATADHQPLADTAPDDAQLTAIARRTAQILLRASLARVTALQTLKAESWDRGAFNQVQEQISRGEKAYSEKRFRAAQDAYRAALVQAARVEAELPGVIAALSQQGDAALAQGNSAAAATAYGQVLAIAPEHHDANIGRARAASLDRVRALVEQAEAYEQMGDEDKARAVYNDAARLDPRTASVKAGLERLDRNARAARMRVALSEGHVALERADYNAARLAFKRAAALDAGSAEVSDALRETDRRAAAAEIAAALERASRAVRSEAWQDAARAYGAALALDTELGAAADGKREAEQRAQLDAQLESLRSDSLALTAQAQRDIASNTLARAQAIAQPGARLRGQIAALSNALSQAREPVSVTLLSDGQTDFSIDGVGALGRFTEHALTLLPGHYHASGRRDDAADVRIEFTIAPGASAPRITLQSAP